LKIIHEICLIINEIYLAHEIYLTVQI